MLNTTNKNERINRNNDSIDYYKLIMTGYNCNCNVIRCSQMSWRLGLQAATGLLLSTFFLGTFYRSASLYHPQRRAILHLKTQRKKVTHTHTHY